MLQSGVRQGRGAGSEPQPRSSAVRPAVRGTDHGAADSPVIPDLLTEGTPSFEAQPVEPARSAVAEPLERPAEEVALRERTSAAVGAWLARRGGRRDAPMVRSRRVSRVALRAATGGNER